MFSNFATSTLMTFKPEVTKDFNNKATSYAPRGGLMLLSLETPLGMYQLTVVVLKSYTKDSLHHDLEWITHRSTFALCLDASFNSLWPSDTLWFHITCSTLIQVLVWWPATPSHYLNYCWLTITEDNFTGNAKDMIWIWKEQIEGYSQCHWVKNAE